MGKTTHQMLSTLPRNPHISHHRDCMIQRRAVSFMATLHRPPSVRYTTELCGNKLHLLWDIQEHVEKANMLYLTLSFRARETHRFPERECIDFRERRHKFARLQALVFAFAADCAGEEDGIGATEVFRGYGAEIADIEGGLVVGVTLDTVAVSWHCASNCRMSAV